MVGWHHQCDGHEFEQALGAGDGQGALECCSPWDHKESDMTQQQHPISKLIRYEHIIFCLDNAQVTLCAAIIMFKAILFGSAAFSYQRCFQLSSVSQSCLTLCNPMDCSMPGFPVHHQPPEPTQTHVHRIGDAIQPSHPLSSPSPPAFNLSQHQGLFQWVSSSHQVAKVLGFQLQHQSFQ